MDSITVKVGKLPGRINEFALGADATIQDALNVAELDPSGYEVRVDGELIDQLGDSLEDGSSVLLSRKIKGN